MSTYRQSIIRSVTDKLQEAYPDYPLTLIPDPDDDATFFVYTFCVPDDKTYKVTASMRRFIAANLKDYLYEFDFIPSVKSMSVTREHYPDKI